ncbi:MAG: DNA methyltransferase, partial [Spirochaetota bacterium]
PYIDKVQKELEFVFLDLRHYRECLAMARKRAETQEDYSEEELKELLPLYKLFSPEHLLKRPFANDSNTLNQEFYHEFLYLMGLEEMQKGSGPKLIGRVEPERRQRASLLENTMERLQAKDCLAGIKNISDYGTPTERLFNVALELVLTWVNRLLFLKLLEGLLRQHKKISFLSDDLLGSYTAIDQLFFQILAVRPEERSESIRKALPKLAADVPYLNSSLFEISPLERETYFHISDLDNSLKMPYYKNTVLRDHYKDKRLSDSGASSEATLCYFLRFLDAYDFSSEGGEALQEQPKTLINAAVLGLVFEKINGYQDGSFFTPGFITMYMCRETLRQAVLDKFREEKNWNCANFTELYNQIRESGKNIKDAIQEANRVINRLKICDPAVGSGHFLVSALNELLAIKSELGILQDKEGRRLRDYSVYVENDELQVLDENGELFQYKPKSAESHRVQETLFHEKQYLIEHCLFGVDINANSVKICQLRLWIELLKHAYYHWKTDVLETLPNIDINIQTGNSLLSRYEMEGDIGAILRQHGRTVRQYR